MSEVKMAENKIKNNDYVDVGADIKKEENIGDSTQPSNNNVYEALR